MPQTDAEISEGNGDDIPTQGWDCLRWRLKRQGFKFHRGNDIIFVGSTFDMSGCWRSQLEDVRSMERLGEFPLFSLLAALDQTFVKQRFNSQNLTGHGLRKCMLD